VNRNDIIKSIANDTQIPQKQVDKVLRSLVDTLALAVSCEEDVVISGFGKFSRKNLSAKVLHDPRNGELMNIDERTSINFKPSNVFKKRLNPDAEETG
jgi:nucleoid DNA-binding protein